MPASMDFTTLNATRHQDLCYPQWTIPFLNNAKGPGDDILPISCGTGFYERRASEGS